MTIDKEKLRPAFEAWYEGSHEGRMRGGECIGNGCRWPEEPDRMPRSDAWKAWCAAFESLGEPVAWVQQCKSSGLIEQSIRGETIDLEYWTADFPVYRLPEVKV